MHLYDPKNGQCNLKIAQISKSCGTYTLHKVLSFREREQFKKGGYESITLHNPIINSNFSDKRYIHFKEGEQATFSSFWGGGGGGGFCCVQTCFLHVQAIMYACFELVGFINDMYILPALNE